MLGFLVLVAIFGFWGVSSYNKLVKLDQAVQAQWSQVENVYQRRADLVPNLVETVKGAAKFEKDTFTAVAQARASVGQVQGNTSPNDPAAVEKFKAAQDQLSSALSRLMVVVERYPDLKATQAFRDLQHAFFALRSHDDVDIRCLQCLARQERRVPSAQDNRKLGIPGFDGL